MSSTHNPNTVYPPVYLVCLVILTPNSLSVHVSSTPIPNTVYASTCLAHLSSHLFVEQHRLSLHVSSTVVYASSSAVYISTCLATHPVIYLSCDTLCPSTCTAPPSSRLFVGNSLSIHGSSTPIQASVSQTHSVSIHLSVK